MKVFLAITLFLVLGSCSGLREYTPPAPPEQLDTIDLTEADGVKYQTVEPLITWWEQLDDPQLTKLIELSLTRNHDIRIAIANLSEARSLLRESRYDRFPTVTANASYLRERLSEEGINGPPADDTVSTYNAGFDAFWELDLFGRISESIAAQQAFEDAALAELQNVYISIAAEVARNYIELRGGHYRLSIAERNASNQQKTFELTKTLSEGGRSTQLDVSRASTQLDLTLATIPPLEAEVYGAISRLGVLTGRLPDALRAELAEIRNIPSIPPAIAVGDASSLLKRRPDIRRTERELAASIAEYNVAVTNLFPVVSITGNLGFLATDFSSLGSSSAFTAGVGPAISWAAFDLGRVRAQIDQSDARTQAALARYEKTVLEAFEEVQNALVNFNREEQRRVRLRRAARSSVESAVLARQRFDAGVDGFLDVLDAERTQLEAENSLAISETTAALDLIAIYKALGGGWQIMMEDEDADKI